jgi:hypothetical protein
MEKKIAKAFTTSKNGEGVFTQDTKNVDFV